MSGQNRCTTIRHRVVAQAAKRSEVTTEITVADRLRPDTNPRLLSGT